MPQKVFTYKPIGFKNTYRLTTIFCFSAGIWFALAPILVETKEESHLIIYGLSVFCTLLAWANYRTLKRIIGYEKLAKGMRVVLDTYQRHIRVEHKGQCIEFNRSDIRIVHVFETNRQRHPSCYFSYLVIELKDGRKVLISKSIADERELRTGLYRVRRNRIKKWGHPVPEDIEF